MLAVFGQQINRFLQTSWLRLCWLRWISNFQYNFFLNTVGLKYDDCLYLQLSYFEPLSDYFIKNISLEFNVAK